MLSCPVRGVWRTRRLPHTPSLRAQRSNPESLRGGSLDCFAALAMTGSYPFPANSVGVRPVT
ncbi:hypothetical protein C7G41_26230 [Bradyrhizobium sp. MOS002]|nr:hypothetical protein C7G41_26230 [Bradyrhizobium sp. MOS002]